MKSESSILVDEKEYHENRKYDEVWFKNKENKELGSDFREIIEYKQSNENGTIYIGFKDGEVVPRDSENSSDKINYFPVYKDEIELVEEYFESTEIEFTQDKKSQLENLKNKWWFQKHRSPRTNAMSRRYILIKNHAERQDPDEKYVLQKELKSLVNQLDSGLSWERIEKLRKKYEKKFPELLPEIVTVFEFIRYVFMRRKFDKEVHKENFDSTEFEDMFEEFCQVQYITSDFVLKNQGNREYLKKFWDFLRDISERLDFNEYRMDGFRRGVLGQVGLYNVLEESELNPSIATPKEDAFRTIDMWIDKEHPVQLKSKIKGNNKAIKRTDTMSFPAVEVSGEGLTYFQKVANEVARFNLNLSEYTNLLDSESLEGFFIVVTNDDFDGINGAPTDEFKESMIESLSDVIEEQN